ncbi:MAG TPA: NAD-dependent epimerase/dehydratase family protein [Candidatus Angelobacter sp.]|jgi:CDP-paratose 2-epimerase|nr:NAD-dependent epimerase/dehydratase family protein [Candidatus Angelobacter sp.]
MSIVLITGSAGLIGSEAVRYFSAQGLHVVGIDNDMRKCFFGPEASTEWMRKQLEATISNYQHNSIDIRDQAAIFDVFRRCGRDISLVIHAAAQPSHDWAAREPLTDFSVNATGTLNLLEATRQFCPDAPFILTSTNKVYGDSPNALPLVELESRWELDNSHRFSEKGITEEQSIDQTTHSVFGASKVAADVMVQEYGRYFGLKTACFRAGCITGPAHSGAQMHGFLAYLMRCNVTGTPYTVFGYEGKQVRDNMHSADLIRAFDRFFQRPGSGEVYNIGGSRFSNCSMVEAISMCEEISGRKMNWKYGTENRIGDHIWWISDISKFQSHYPGYELQFDCHAILREIHDRNQGRWKGSSRAVHA